MQLFLKLFFHLSLILITSAFLTACRKEIPNPETLDPIYKDLVAKSKNFSKLLSDEEKILKGLVEESKNIEVRTIDKTVNKREIAASKKKIAIYRQKAKYYKIKSERRRVEGRRAYKIAFSKGETWPDPEEYKKYKTYMRLRTAPLNWSKRVPKLFEKSPNFKDK